MALKKKGEEKVLDVDASMQGNLSFKDPVNLRINGRFEGNLEVRGTLTVGAAAMVKADIVGDSIVIEGRVKGKIIARDVLTLSSEAIVEGDIFPLKLNIFSGAIFDGKCQMLHDLLSAEELARYLEVDLKSITDWASSGRIPGIKNGDGWRFERKNIDAWVASGKMK